MPVDPEAVRRFELARWQQAASAYEASFATATRQFIDPLLDAVDIASGTRLLDVACGPGLVATRAKQRGALSRGLDFSPAMLAIARERNPAISFDEGDAEVLPYPDQAFDAVVSNFGIHHVPRPHLALRAAHRVLRDGGRVAFSFWADHRDNIGWKLLFDAVARHGDASASDAPLPGGGFRGADQCAEALCAAGFADCTTKLVNATWHHADARALVATLQAGTARMAAMIEAQDPNAMPAIIADIEANAVGYLTAGGIAVPIAAVIATGARH